MVFCCVDIFCVVGILSGIFLRTTGVLGESIEDQIAEWQKAGYDSSYAKQLVVYQNLAIKPNWEAVEINEIQKMKMTTSFSNQTSGICDKIKLGNNEDDPELVLYAYKDSGEELTALAEVIENQITDKEVRKELLGALEEVICKLESKK